MTATAPWIFQVHNPYFGSIQFYMDWKLHNSRLKEIPNSLSLSRAYVQFPWENATWRQNRWDKKQNVADAADSAGMRKTIRELVIIVCISDLSIRYYCQVTYIFTHPKDCCCPGKVGKCWFLCSASWKSS